jgi:hypothetical protein
MRVNAIPHPRVKAMIAKREGKIIAAVAKELGITKAEAELKLEDIIGGVKERGTKFGEYEQRIRTVEGVEAIMANDPDRFMQLLVQINPGYGAYAKQQAQAAAAAQKQTAHTDDDPEPEPDYDLGDGKKTYSLDGLKKRDAWSRRQAIKELNAGLDQRLKPFEDQAKAQREAEAEAARKTEMNAHLQKRIERARKWPQFKENEAEILSAMDAERTKGNFVTFEDAYMQVVVPRLAGDRTKIRQEVLDEINGVPKTSSVATTTAVAKQDAGKPKTTADIAREVMAQFEK